MAGPIDGVKKNSFKIVRVKPILREINSLVRNLLIIILFFLIIRVGGFKKLLLVYDYKQNATVCYDRCLCCAKRVSQLKDRVLVIAHLAHLKNSTVMFLSRL